MVEIITLTRAGFTHEVFRVRHDGFFIAEAGSVEELSRYVDLADLIEDGLGIRTGQPAVGVAPHGGPHVLGRRVTAVVDRDKRGADAQSGLGLDGVSAAPGRPFRAR